LRFEQPCRGSAHRKGTAFASIAGVQNGPASVQLLCVWRAAFSSQIIAGVAGVAATTPKTDLDTHPLDCRGLQPTV